VTLTDSSPFDFWVLSYLNHNLTDSESSLMSHRLCDSAPSLLSLLHRASLCRHCLAAVTCHRPTAHCAQPPHLGVNRSIHWPCRHWQRVGVRVVRLSQRRLSDIQVAATLPSCGLVNWVCWVAPLRLGLQPGSLGAPIIAANAPLRHRLASPESRVGATRWLAGRPGRVSPSPAAGSGRIPR
jgi:hypothetical protein